MNDATNTKKKDTFYVIVLILTFIIVFIGATFAIFMFVKSQKEGSSAVYTGTFSIEYLNSRIINVDLLTPIEEPDYMESKNVYRNDFKVSNTGSLDGTIDVYVNIKENQFSDDTIMYNLFDDNGEKISTGFINGEDDIMVGSDISLNKGSVLGYTLMIWINENYTDQNEEMKKGLTGMIEVKANQKIE